MECPKCGSSQVKRLPPSQISPHPGYQCGECGIKMRSSGMLFVYLLTLLIGIAIGAVMVYMLIEEDGGNRPFQAAWLGAAGLIVAGYSVMQIARPVPRPQPKTDEVE
ncbi:hypothetical protein [Zavarzinella formosa]|uniref:hypothetical protein n=1 Tax=Zavarzinella formosa TaxID=360055 RepID=UPI00031FDE09|nr:hypothetical protein [Zavarzinella formosa]